MATKKAAAKAKALSKAALIVAISEETNKGEHSVSKSQVKAVLEAVQAVAHRELKRGVGAQFALPGFAKFEVKKKAATKARQGVNPRTREPMTISAKPARKSISARAIKALKDAVT
jgi:DNA-binding protein HU-beta